MVQPRSSLFSQWAQKRSGEVWGLDPEDYDPQAVSRVLEKTKHLFGRQAYFGLRVEGWEEIQAKPSLFVSNHSGGMLAIDAFGFVAGWYQTIGVQRPLHVLAHELILTLKATGEPLSKVGVLRAEPTIAQRVLEEWQRDLLVYPGGDVDTFRPYKDRYKVNFAGRKGYARLALKAGVSITPIAHAGAHETLMVLTSGEKLAEKMGLPKLARARIFPIHLSFPWGLSIGPWPHIPPPTLFRYKIGTPLELPKKTWLSEPPDSVVEETDQRVQTAVQGLLDELHEEEPLMKRTQIRDAVEGWLERLAFGLAPLRGLLR